MKNVCSREPCDSHRFAHFPFHIVHCTLHCCQISAIFQYTRLQHNAVELFCFAASCFTMHCKVWHFVDSFLLLHILALHCILIIMFALRCIWQLDQLQLGRVAAGHLQLHIVV